MIGLLRWGEEITELMAGPGVGLMAGAGEGLLAGAGEGLVAGAGEELVGGAGEGLVAGAGEGLMVWEAGLVMTEQVVGAEEGLTEIELVGGKAVGLGGNSPKAHVICLKVFWDK